MDDVNAKQLNASIELLEAAEKGDEKKTAELIQIGANVDISQNTGWNALMLA